MSEHTKGPWDWQDEGSIYEFEIVGKDGTSVCECQWYQTDNFSELCANARLIAAAPELLSIVQRFVALPSGAWHPERHAAEEAELLTEARAVVAKAVQS